MKIKVTDKDIKKLSTLSGLTLTPEEEKKIGAQFSETLDFIGNLSELDTNNVDERANLSKQTNKFFQDGELNKRLLTSKEAQSNAKKTDKGQFVVPKVLNK